MTDVTMPAHMEVGFGETQRPGQNRYRAECGYYWSCVCVHPVGTHAWCPKHGVSELITDSVTSVWNPITRAYAPVYAHDEGQ
jgi:hypothetical protein